MNAQGRPRRPNRVAAILVSVLALLVAACGDTPPPPAPPAAFPVQVIQARMMTVPIYGEAVGNTLAVETVEIRSRVNGHLLERKFADGALVREGQLLFLIDPDQYEQDLVRAEAQLGYARISLDLARKDTQRYATLLRQALISQEVFDLKQIKEEEAAANVVVSETSVNLAKLNIRHTRITSPIGGRIGFAKVDKGALVNAGSTLLARISTVNPMHFYFYLSEEDYLNMADHFGDDFEKIIKDLDVQLTLAGGVVYDHLGHLDMFDREVDPKTGTVAARAVFPNPDGMLRPGMFGRVRVTLEREWDLLLIPQQAVMDTLGRKSVFVVDAQDQVASRPVQMGQRMGNLWHVSSGLEPGEKVAVDSLQKLRPGMPVAPTVVSYALESSEQAQDLAQEQDQAPSQELPPDAAPDAAPEPAGASHSPMPDAPPSADEASVSQ
ncbi:efflux RND transporter periplasmic adaptor subunit [Desulfonatronovibrio magnus]|uniref:efflux RND transporter periplasmic adaptor subunit n=1 Tax=Desulfonatronovibrio magnus TaxID=698827 RepID=UPI000AB4F0B0|nr:efflux RND transporter periplasmic adaptor subunit [Desulfonatronovibrio magnus]